MNKKEMIVALEESGLAAYIDDLTPLMQTAIRAVPTRVEDEDEIPIGASKLGGRPDLPVGGQWPVVDDVLLAFVGQFRMADVAPLDETGLLPQEGILYFFFDGMLTGYAEGDAVDRCKVIHYVGPDEDLRRVGPPQRADTESFLLFYACTLDFEITETLPPSVEIYGDFFPIINPVPFEDLDACNQYQLVRRAFWDPGTQFLGHVVELQGEEEKFYALQKRYPGRYVYEDYDYAHKDELQQRMKDLVLLFTAASEPEADMMWGDGGLVYYWIDRQDLAAGRWDAVWASMVCG